MTWWKRDNNGFVVVSLVLMIGVAVAIMVFVAGVA